MHENRGRKMKEVADMNITSYGVLVPKLER